MSETEPKSDAYRAELFRRAVLVVCNEHGFSITTDDSCARLVLMPAGVEDARSDLEAAELYVSQPYVPPVWPGFLPVKDDTHTLFAGPPEMEHADPLWQKGYADGEEDKPPAHVSFVYISGWCHGHCEAHQTSELEAEAAYYKAAEAVAQELEGLEQLDAREDSDAVD
jgi:hypothetical protein